MSPLEFHLAAKGHMAKHWNQWDMVRHQMYTVASTVKSKRKLPKITIWFPLPNDKDTHNEEGIKEMFSKLKEKLKAHGNKRATGSNNG